MFFLISLVTILAKTCTAFRIVAFQATDNCKFKPMYAAIACLLVGTSLASASVILISGGGAYLEEMISSIFIAACVLYSGGNVATLLNPQFWLKKWKNHERKENH